MIDLLFFLDRLSEYIFRIPPVSYALSKYGTPLLCCNLQVLYKVVLNFVCVFYFG